ncbi:ABC transporter ATP-binding protein [Streptomyces sp. DSM 40750]|uniref:ABC transporter ATP-binding protein n=1 Tax=Streptomyces sp. DSM 40750 TaxID=2801030 RepID=UPI00214AEDE7|nr:ABC transporter ATP-binding protein [Streptomyces sp. DSM 40750]UUU19198.1 ABC transporter ATP-binding protein [Streptomyces sp. DSM 40750]UUU27459.1 ABC transporter ATP-binding protein [Streptomyces sp. DSM 40750]
MAELRITGVHKAYGRVQALSGVDLTVRSGSLVAVLGPSGSGKTTLLRCVAGFEALDSGEIRIDGRRVATSDASVPPERRRIAVVPQEGALFPHLSVLGNVAYGLGRSARRAGRAAAVLDLVGLAGLQDRMPHHLSGGQQQRVAVARALAPRPPVVLLDEPFNALDAALRAEVRRDVWQALRADGATAVLVTHDQAEALSMAEEVAAMRDGRIIQSGPPELLYGSPADPWVAGFVGEAVWLPAVRDGDRAHTPLGTLRLTPVEGGVPAGPMRVLLRPEQITLAPPGAANGVAATVVRRDFYGHDAMLALRLSDGTPVAARVFDPSVRPPAVGDEVGLCVRGIARAFPPGGRLVSPAQPSATDELHP